MFAGSRTCKYMNVLVELTAIEMGEHLEIKTEEREREREMEGFRPGK